MKNYKHLLLTIFLTFILLPNIIYADCTEEDQERFKEVEDEYKITYKFNQDTKDYTLTTHSSLPDEFDFIVYVGEDADFEEITPNEYRFYNIPSGTYDIEIVGQTEECDRVFKSTTIELPEYNNYSSDPLCEGIEEFVLCQPTYGKYITYEEFVERVNVYKKTKVKKKEAEEQKNKDIMKPIISYLEDNLFRIIAIVVFIAIVVVTIILTTKSIRKSRRLE